MPPFPAPPTPEEFEAMMAELRATPMPPAFDYEAYRANDLWKRIRKRVVKRDKRICQSCGGEGHTVHHRSYDQPVLDGHADEFLVTVCDGCHDLVHNTDDGKRRPQDEWDTILAQPKPETFPEPVVPQTNGTTIPLVSEPEGWSRMTAKQRAGWNRSVLATLRARFPKLLRI